MKKGSEATSKLERKTVEKNRRLHMKSLCFKLSTLLPPDNSTVPKDALTQEDHLDQATNYIKKMQERIEDLKYRKGMGGRSRNSGGRVTAFRSPIIEIRDFDSTLEVVLICGLNKRFLFYEVIIVLEEEGAEVVNATFSTVGDKIFYTIHSQVTFPGIGLEASRVSDRLKMLV